MSREKPTLLEAANQLMNLKKIKRRIEAGLATHGEQDFYEKHKEEAWTALERALCGSTLMEMPRLPSVLTIQHGGQHYKGRAIQPVEYSHANNLSFNLGSVVKYVTRHREKDGLMGLKKAVHFLQFELEQVYGVRTRVEYDEPKEVVLGAEAFVQHVGVSERRG